MKSIFIAGSRKFFGDIENYANFLRGNNIEVQTPKKGLSNGSFEKEKEALFRAFKLIDNCNLLYIFAKEGYVGKTVAMEITYAFVRGKEIISLEKIEEHSARALVSKIMTKEELMEYCK